MYTSATTHRCNSKVDATLPCSLLQGGARCPDLPLGLCPRLWDERHIPSRDADDVAIYGAGLARKQNWPAWLLVGLLTSMQAVHLTIYTRSMHIMVLCHVY